MDRLEVDIKPHLPLFSQSHKKSREINSPGLTKKEAAKYKGFAAFLKAKQHNASVIAAEKKLAALKKKTETEK